MYIWLAAIAFKQDHPDLTRAADAALVAIRACPIDELVREHAVTVL